MSFFTTSVKWLEEKMIGQGVGGADATVNSYKSTLQPTSHFFRI